ncbi:MAG: hypothetical protein GX247_04600 [Mollicutes bacterium]|nr:hypothetical protein [Mollicutes bacterium]
MFRININKKLELLNFDNTYFERDDFVDSIEFIQGDGSVQKSKGNLVLHKAGYDDETIITIGEKNNLTDNAYKSLLTIIEIIYDEEEKGNFASNFPKLENKSYGRYELVINPELDEFYSVIFNDDYEILQLKINNANNDGE